MDFKILLHTPGARAVNLRGPKSGSIFANQKTLHSYFMPQSPLLARILQRSGIDLNYKMLLQKIMNTGACFYLFNTCRDVGVVIDVKV